MMIVSCRPVLFVSRIFAVSVMSSVLCCVIASRTAAGTATAIFSVTTAAISLTAAAIYVTAVGTAAAICSVTTGAISVTAAAISVTAAATAIGIVRAAGLCFHVCSERPQRIEYENSL